MTGEVDGHGAEGLALHLFQRNPDSHLIGAKGSHLSYRGQEVDRIGLEGELYRGPWTLGGNLGGVRSGMDSQANAGTPSGAVAGGSDGSGE